MIILLLAEQLQLSTLPNSRGLLFPGGKQPINICNELILNGLKIQTSAWKWILMEAASHNWACLLRHFCVCSWSRGGALSPVTICTAPLHDSALPGTRLWSKILFYVGFFSYILVAIICDMPYLWHFLHLGQCQKWVVWPRTSRQDVGLYKPIRAGSSSLPAQGRGWKGLSPSFLGEPLHPRGCAQLLLGDFSLPFG